MRKMIYQIIIVILEVVLDLIVAAISDAAAAAALSVHEVSDQIQSISWSEYLLLRVAVAATTISPHLKD